MTWEPRPLPEVTPETARFWSATLEERFLLNRCRVCDRVYHPPRSHCPDCLGNDVGWLGAQGDGTVYAFSIVRRASGWPEEHVPFVLAYISLPEGPTVMTNLVDVDIEDETSQITVGDAVSIRFIPTDAGHLAIPVFTPR